MYTSDEMHARELRLMAQLYAQRGEQDKAKKARLWSDSFANFSMDRLNVENDHSEKIESQVAEQPLS